METYLQSTDANYEAYLDTIVKQAEDRISKSVIMPMNRKNTPLVLTYGLTTVELPTDFLAPFEFRVNSSGEFSSVSYQDVSYMRETYPNSLMVGVPRYYSMFDADTLVMAPTPSEGLTGWLNYFYKPASIVDAGTSWLGTNAENCLLYACLAEGYTFLKGDADLMKLYEEKFQMALKDLRTLGEGLDLGDAARMGERRAPR